MGKGSVASAGEPGPRWRLHASPEFQSDLGVRQALGAPAAQGPQCRPGRDRAAARGPARASGPGFCQLRVRWSSARRPVCRQLDQTSSPCRPSRWFSSSPTVSQCSAKLISPALHPDAVGSARSRLERPSGRGHERAIGRQHSNCHLHGSTAVGGGRLAVPPVALSMGIGLAAPNAPIGMSATLKSDPDLYSHNDPEPPIQIPCASPKAVANRAAPAESSHIFVVWLGPVRSSKPL